MRKHLHTFFIALYLCILSGTFLFLFTSAAPFTSRISAVDSSVFRYIGKLISEGYMPYKDIFDHKGPLLYVINYLGHILSPRHGIWFVEWAFMICTFSFVYKIARLFCEKIAACFVVAICAVALAPYFSTGNMTEEYALPFIAFAVYVFIDYMLHQHITKLRLFGFGVGFGAVCMLRPNMISVWVVFSVAVCIQSLCKKEYKKMGTFILYVLLGGVAIVLPLLLWLSVRHALVPFFETYILFNFQYSNVIFQDKLHVMALFLSNVLFIGCVWILIGFILLKKNRLLHTINLIAMLLSLILISMSGYSYSHYFMVMIPLYVCPIAALLSVLLQHFQRKQLLIYVAFIVFVAFFISGSRLVLNGPGYITTAYEKKVYTTMINSLTDYVLQNTEENDEILICGNSCSVYTRSGRKPSTIKYMFLPPLARISAEMKADYIRELSLNKPRLLILDMQYTIPEVQQFYPELMEFLENNYDIQNAVYHKTWTAYTRNP